MPKRKKKTSDPETTEPSEASQARVPASERREEEYSFNCYARRSIKVTTVVEAVEEIKDIKKRKHRK